MKTVYFGMRLIKESKQKMDLSEKIFKAKHTHKHKLSFNNKKIV